MQSLRRIKEKIFVHVFERFSKNQMYNFRVAIKVLLLKFIGHISFTISANISDTHSPGKSSEAIGY